MGNAVRAPGGVRGPYGPALFAFGWCNYDLALLAPEEYFTDLSYSNWKVTFKCVKSVKATAWVSTARGSNYYPVLLNHGNVKTGDTMTFEAGQTYELGYAHGSPTSSNANFVLLATL